VTGGPVIGEGWAVLAAVSLGTAAGAVGRWQLDRQVSAATSRQAPAPGSPHPARWQPAWGTVTVNALGCLLLGFLLAWAGARGLLGCAQGVCHPTSPDGPVPEVLLALLATGVCGGMTTMSAVAVQAAQSGRGRRAVAVLAVNAGAGLVSLAGGWAFLGWALAALDGPLL